MSSVTLKNINKVYPDGFRAVIDFNLEIGDKEFIILVGPSGCGKSTALRMIAGLENITGGELYIDDQLCNNTPSKDRDIAMVFQNYALYPHMTVFKNMAFALKLCRTSKDEIRTRVEEAAKILEITHLLERKPKELSGGQKQRVALGRAIVRRPKVFLLDEPLSNLDAKLRAQMRTEIAKLHTRLDTTFIYVTHDQVEAMTMGTKVVVMKDGNIQQIDTPQAIYEKPANLFVATFVGSPKMNTIDATLVDREGVTYLAFGMAEIALPERIGRSPGVLALVGREIVMGIRPESIHDEEQFISQMQNCVVEAHVEVVEKLGSDTYLYLLCEGNQLTVRVSPRSAAKPGDIIKVAFDTNKVLIFDKESEKTINLL
ncbi:sn-glycerol-3-phosphate ABC transporter ATP-binding protein UgpC [Brevibacillus borstelensis]|uniref:ABC transporter ATP-binding protein n=1 Tax=Brevibacillus borstelensis TaxID=45462 RepID=UPI0030C14D63